MIYPRRHAKLLELPCAIFQRERGFCFPIAQRRSRQLDKGPAQSRANGPQQVDQMLPAFPSQRQHRAVIGMAQSICVEHAKQNARRRQNLLVAIHRDPAVLTQYTGLPR